VVGFGSDADDENGLLSTTASMVSTWSDASIAQMLSGLFLRSSVDNETGILRK